MHVIRASATSAFIVGINYVGGRKKRLHHMFLTTSDIEVITKLTLEFTHMFWRRVNAVMHQKDTVQNILKTARFSPRSKLTLNNLIISLATAVITKTIAIATVKKAHDIKDTRDYHIKSAQANEVVTWATQQDERVCPFCDSLDGMQWNSDDPNMLIPPDDAHPNCRCRLDVAGSDDSEGILPGIALGTGAGLGTAIGEALTPSECPEGTVWDDNKNKCVNVCPEGQVWDSDLQDCVDTG